MDNTCNPDTAITIAETALAIQNLANYLAFDFPYNVPEGMSRKGLWERAQYGCIEMTGATPEEALKRNLELLDAFRAANPAVQL